MNEKYAVGEFERRFLLSAVPTDARDPRNIVDRYIDGTRLRLRTVTDEDHHESAKLGHKRRLADDDPTQIMCTSMYLDDQEFEVLSALPGRPLAKTRWSVDIADRRCSVDEFSEDLHGLILLEVDLAEPEELENFVPPHWAGREVTHNETFTGGALAGTCFDDIADLVASLLAE